MVAEVGEGDTEDSLARETSKEQKLEVNSGFCLVFDFWTWIF